MQDSVQNNSDNHENISSKKTFPRTTSSWGRMFQMYWPKWSLAVEEVMELPSLKNVACLESHPWATRVIQNGSARQRCTGSQRAVNIPSIRKGNLSPKRAIDLRPAIAQEQRQALTPGNQFSLIYRSSGLAVFTPRKAVQGPLGQRLLPPAALTCRVLSHLILFYTHRRILSGSKTMSRWQRLTQT